MKSGEAKLFIGILIVAIVLVSFAAFPTIMSRKGRPPAAPRLSRTDLIPSFSHKRGIPDAPYTLVEFGDYQCPTCKTVKTEVEEVMKKYGSKMNYVFHHTQASPSHQHTYLLAQAAEAAGAQGKFWEMHELIFREQDKFRQADEKEVVNILLRLASGLKLDLLRFRPALSATNPAAKVAKEMVDKQEAVAQKAAVISTPSFFLVTAKGEVKSIRPGPGELRSFLDDPKNWE